MKTLLCLCILCFVSGCGKITNLISDTAPETQQTGDPIYDSDKEVKLLLPWTLFI